MASRKDAEFQGELTEATSSNRGLSNEQEGKNVDFDESSPAILEPSEDEPLFKRDASRKPLRTYKAIMTPFNSSEIYANSDEFLNEREPTDRSRSCCFSLFNRYKSFVTKFRKSKLLFIVQVSWILLPFSAIAMGMKYSNGCPGSPSLTFFTVFTGLMALILIGQWLAITCCRTHDRPCEGQQKILILFFFVLVGALLELEIYLFTKLPLSFEPSAVNYCSKMFYDYTYYKFIAAFGSVFLVVLLYLPDYQRLASGVVCSDPLVASCYKGIDE